MELRRVSFILALLLLLTACGGTASQTGTAGGGATTAAGAGSEAGGAASASDSGAFRSANTSEQPAAAEAAPAAEKPQAGGGAAGNSAGTTEQQSAAQFGRKVILNASLTLQVANADATEQKVRDLVQRVGGYVLKSETSGDEKQRSVRLTAKVPSARFDETLNTVVGPEYAVKVLSRSVSGEDVTDEYVDLESRLRALKATETRLLDFLSQAKTVQEALAVNQQLTELQSQIEQVSGRINFLKESTSFSTINLDLQPDVVLALTSPVGWRPGVTARNAWNGLLEFAQGIADVAIVLGIWAPVWGLTLLVGLTAWRRLNRRPEVPRPTTQP